MSIKTYDPDKVIVTFGGVPLSGYADGTFVNVERAEDAFTLSVGADGETARTRNLNKSGTITITLMQSSASNDLLSGAAIADESTGLGIFPVMIKDMAGTTLAIAANAWVKKMANAEFGKEHGDREWVLEADSITMHVGGTGSNGLLPF